MSKSKNFNKFSYIIAVEIWKFIHVQGSDKIYEHVKNAI